MTAAASAPTSTKKNKTGPKAKPAPLTLPAMGALPLPLPHAYGGAFLCGLLYWLAFAGMDVWPLAFVAWVPLVVAMHRQTPKHAALMGWLAGTTMNVFGFIWLQEMLKTFSGFPTPICFFFVLVVCSYQGGRVALMGWLYGRASARGWPAAVVMAAAFAASELLYPLLFPWYYAATVHQIPALTQVADLGGPILVGLVLLGANLAIAEPILARLERRKPVVAVIGTGAVTLALGIAYGVMRIGMVDAVAQNAPSATVGVVQANMGLLEKRNSVDDGLRRHLDLSQHLEADSHVDFLVWSETSAMRPVWGDHFKDQLRAGVGRRIGAPAIFGAVVVEEVADERERVYHNTAVASDKTGAITGRYDKQFLLAFGEYLPFGEDFPILYKWSPNSGHFTPGKSLEPLDLRLADGTSHAVTVLICYEDILPEFTNDAVRHGNPELLVNMTNDAWFGDTAEPWEHLALAQFRAIEHRRYLVRGTNSGVSAVVDPVGRVIAKSGTFQQQGISSEVHWLRAHTVYERIGDWPWLLASVALVVGAFRRRDAKASTASAPAAASV
jgi:apolipoprotein N-acyltransferase